MNFSSIDSYFQKLELRKLIFFPSLTCFIMLKCICGFIKISTYIAVLQNRPWGHQVARRQQCSWGAKQPLQLELHLHRHSSRAKHWSCPAAQHWWDHMRSTGSRSGLLAQDRLWCTGVSSVVGHHDGQGWSMWMRDLGFSSLNKEVKVRFCCWL